MRIVITSYNSVEEFDNPPDWLKRIGFYTGILEGLARYHDVISIERINYKGTYQQNGVQYNFIQHNGKLAFFPFRMHRLIRKLQPDVVLVHGFIFPAQIIQLRWAIGKQTKIIVQNHAEKPTRGIRTFLQRKADRYINSYLFTSKEMGREWVEKGIIKSNEKIAEIMEVSSSFTANEKNERNTLEFTTLFFLWVGRLNANKDPLTVVKAFINFLFFEPSAKLYMIYQAEELLPQIKALIATKENAKEAITLVGAVPNQQLQEWYNKADFFISGSHYESGGVAVCEAMSCGCIPVITDIFSFRRMTGPDKCGLLYEPGNHQALLTSLLQTRNMDIEKERIKVLRQFRDELSFNAIAGKIDKVLASL